MLVRCDADSDVAHRDAYQHKILHRDISGGNVLMRPIITIIHGRTLVRIAGLLADWEMAQDVSEPRTRQQPERTASVFPLDRWELTDEELRGTWQFMSVALLNAWKDMVELTDDLESFLHVITYHAVRYQKSNVTDVANWLRQYFDDYSLDGDEYRCGYRKTISVTTGRLKTVDARALMFNSPLDALLRDLLQSFEAHYAVLNYDWYLGTRASGSPLPSVRSEPGTSPAHTPSPESPTSIHPSTRLDVVVDDDDDDDDDYDGIELGPSPVVVQEATGPKEPTAQQRELAKSVTSHNELLVLLRKASNPSLWAGLNDGAHDRVPSNWSSGRLEGPTFQTIAQTWANVKRRRTAYRNVPGDEDTDIDDEIDEKHVEAMLASERRLPTDEDVRKAANKPRRGEASRRRGKKAA